MPGPLFIKKYNVTNTVTTAQLAFIVSNNNLVVGQIYVVSDSAVVALAITNNTYKDIAVLGAGGGGGGDAVWGGITGTLSSQTDLNSALAGKQATLSSGTNIKTINGSSILGAGDLVISGGGSNYTRITLTVSPVAIGYAEVVVTDASVNALSRIYVNFVADLDAENDVESIADDNLRVWPVAEAGQIRFVLTGNGPFIGPYRIDYRVGA